MNPCFTNLPIMGFNRSLFAVLNIAFSNSNFFWHLGWILCFISLMEVNLKAQKVGLFDAEEILELKISGDLKSLFKKRGDDLDYFECTLVDASKAEESIPLKIKARGNFRLKHANCEYPPLLLNFSKKNTPKTSIFSGQDKLKLVVPCRGQQDLIEEYLIYRMYSLLSPFAFKVRRVKIDFYDRFGLMTEGVQGFIIEDDDLMAKRLGGEIFKVDGLSGNKMDRESYLIMAVFQYMIGNTDWSTEFRHNMKLLRNENLSLPAPIPYDFDHAGFVDAPYARPAQELNMRDVTERRFRGFCLDNLQELQPTFSLFEAKKSELISMVEDADLGATNKLRLVSYLEMFYRVISDPKKIRQEFNYPCLRAGTGNVIIKGLN